MCKTILAYNDYIEPIKDILSKDLIKTYFEEDEF